MGCQAQWQGGPRLIPAANITAWRRQAPWPSDNQVEQDLILSRLIVEIANHELLGGELALRGGTCLHKLHLPEPLRYSEDLDYVRRTRSGIKPYLEALRDIAVSVGLTERGTEQTGEMVHATFDGVPTSRVGRIRVKIETNIAETGSYLPRVSRTYVVDSPWWHGKGEISTFVIEEMMGTKLRALYQRSKGRDLFDLWRALADLSPNDEEIVNAFNHHMGERVFSFPELARNLNAKLRDRDFRDDLSQLITDPPADSELDGAADLVMERLGSRLRNAPDPDEMRGGAWRK